MGGTCGSHVPQNVIKLIRHHTLLRKKRSAQSDINSDPPRYLSPITGVTVDVERRQQSHQLLFVPAPVETSASRSTNHSWSLMNYIQGIYYRKICWCVFSWMSESTETRASADRLSLPMFLRNESKIQNFTFKQLEKRNLGIFNFKNDTCSVQL